MRLRGTLMLAAMTVIMGCGSPETNSEPNVPLAEVSASTPDRQYFLERVDDAAIVQLYADGFDQLPLREKILIWHLYQAALAGRDIYYDQRYVHNLEMRDLLEEILTHSDAVNPATLAEIHRYTKLFWINTGPFNNLTARKFVMNITPDSFGAAAHAAAKAGAHFRLRNGETLDQFLDRFVPLFFDPNTDTIVTNKTPSEGQDLLLASVNNLYDGVSMSDLVNFDEQYPLNSRLVKRDERLEEEIYRIDGRYGKELREVVRHLEAAMPYATEPMAKALATLARWYRTGDAADRRAYDIAWVADQNSPVDTINGFTEVYMDARGVKGSWEALVFYVNHEKTQAIRTIAEYAQWFEDHMPWDAMYRKDGVRGITANAIEVVIEIGDSGPITPIGINLPNDQSVREEYGSKSVSLANVTEAYELSRPPSYRQEFAWTEEEAHRSEKWGGLAGELSTNMHEVIGHGSGRVADHLKGNPQEFLKEHYSALEEARADLVALYFIADPKLVEIGIIPAIDHEDVILAHYESYTRNALLQLRRIRQGSQLEEDHMRNRQMIVHWVMDNADAIDVRTREDKTFYVVTDWRTYREAVEQLLAEVQRIKSEGDYAAAKDLFESYGIYFDTRLRDEILERVDQVGLPSYSGFVMPKLEPVTDTDGEITNITISYPMDLTEQMLQYSGKRQ